MFRSLYIYLVNYSKMTRKERDVAIVQFFEKCLSKGTTKVEATKMAQEKFGFLTDIPIYNARRRVANMKQGKEVNNGK